MDRLESLGFFVRVVETGSFSSAARETGVGQPSVSKHIARLESYLGVQLLRRTTRGISLTDAGQDYYASAVRLLGDLEAMDSRAGRGQTVPSGRVRVALSGLFGRINLVQSLPAFFARYPNISLEISVSERQINMIEDGVDLALYVGDLANSTAVTRTIGCLRVSVVAAADYLARNQVPETVEDLLQHHCIVHVFDGAPRQWLFGAPDRPIMLRPRAVFQTNDVEQIREAIVSGLGIGYVPAWLVADEIASGRVQMLSLDLPPLRYALRVVYPPSRRLPAKCKVFVDYLAEIYAADPNLAL